MASTYSSKYVTDIPLKRPRETFVDDPHSLDEVSLNELEFDLANDIKDINRLQIFHAIAIFHATLQDLIKLSAHADLLCKFRQEQLDSYNIDVTDLSFSATSNVEEPLLPSDALAVDFSDAGVALADPDSYVSLSEAAKIGLDASALSPLRQSSDADMSDAVTPNGDEVDVAHEEFISTESLIQSTSLDQVADPITCHSNERVKSEALFYLRPNIQQQSEHLLKVFSLAKEPSVSIKDFLLRINKYSPSVSISVYIHCAYMLFKLCALYGAIPLTPLNVYRLIAALIRCLTKKLEDIYQKQRSFAQVVGVDLKDLCKFEISFLYLCNFKLIVSEYILNHFLTKNFLALRSFCKKHFPESSAEHNENATN